MSPFPSGKAHSDRQGEQDAGVEPDFPMMNNGKGKTVDPRYRLHFSNTPAILSTGGKLKRT